ncbi:MAG: hypothetical protein GWP19_06165 [Planctomycetia bacterium]|nr:hypothetical protein [Planctomycetia bacterium]
MKILILTIIAILFVQGSIYAQNDVNANMFSQHYKHKFYGGYANVPIKVSGYKNAVLNDYHKYPYATGGTYINFEKGNVSGSGKGFMIGYQYMLGENHGPLAEYIGVKNGEDRGTIINFGYSYAFKPSHNLDVAIVPKYGLTSIDYDVGYIEDIGVMPIITDSGTFYKGDTISASASGSAISVSFEANYDLSNVIYNLSVYAQIGYQISFFKKPRTTINGVYVTDEQAFDEGYVDGYTVYATFDTNIDPFEDTKVSMGGLVFALGVSYRL